MAGLKLRLKAHERVLINGTVIENGDRPCELSVMSQGAHILRLRDALHPDEVRTPVTRVCYIAQLAVAGEVNDVEACRQLTQGITQLLQVFLDPESQSLLTGALADGQGGNFYKCMQSLRRLLPLEQKLMARAAKNTSVPALPQKIRAEGSTCSA